MKFNNSFLSYIYWSGIILIFGFLILVSFDTDNMSIDKPSITNCCGSH